MLLPPPLLLPPPSSSSSSFLPSEKRRKSMRVQLSLSLDIYLFSLIITRQHSPAAELSIDASALIQNMHNSGCAPLGFKTRVWNHFLQPVVSCIECSILPADLPPICEAECPPRRSSDRWNYHFDTCAPVFVVLEKMNEALHSTAAAH